MRRSKGFGFGHWMKTRRDDCKVGSLECASGLADSFAPTVRRNLARRHKLYTIIPELLTDWAREGRLDVIFFGDAAGKGAGVADPDRALASAVHAAVRESASMIRRQRPSAVRIDHHRQLPARCAAMFTISGSLELGRRSAQLFGIEEVLTTRKRDLYCQ